MILHIFKCFYEYYITIFGLSYHKILNFIDLI